MERCLECGAPGEWYCLPCLATLARLHQEIRKMGNLMGENESEGGLAIAASQVLEAFERIEHTTALGKVAINRKARELLAEVEDHFTYTPYCPQCRTHKLELIPGDPIGVTCHGGCTF